MKKRCAWVPEGNKIYEEYHDKEWGTPVYDDRVIFEFLVLESAQAGLSWSTILNKRSGYRRAFANFNPNKVAGFTKRDVNRLLKDASIVRNRAKIEAAINNAKRFLEVKKEFGTFCAYIWQFVDGSPIQNKWGHIKDVPAITPEAEVLAKDLKARGFKFLGPTTLYAHMQGVGMANDHTTDCFRYKEVVRLAKK